jgi:uncharacterized protein (UPF0333 family)
MTRNLLLLLLVGLLGWAGLTFVQHREAERAAAEIAAKEAALAAFEQASKEASDAFSIAVDAHFAMERVSKAVPYDPVAHRTATQANDAAKLALDAASKRSRAAFELVNKASEILRPGF